MTKLLMKCDEKGKLTMGKSTLCYFTFIISVENNTIYITKSSRVSMYLFYYQSPQTNNKHKPVRINRNAFNLHSHELTSRDE